MVPACAGTQLRRPALCSIPAFFPRSLRSLEEALAHLQRGIACKYVAADSVGTINKVFQALLDAAPTNRAGARTPACRRNTPVLLLLLPAATVCWWYCWWWGGGLSRTGVWRGAARRLSVGLTSAAVAADF